MATQHENYAPNVTVTKRASQAYNNLSLNSVFSSLKSGLEETLSIWYPAAGRLNLNPNDGKLNLWCNNEGAFLIEAVTQVKISELGDLSHYNEFFENLIYKPFFNGNFSVMPLVVAQVTKFGCGGYSVGIGTSHSLFDGPATFDFLRAWACNSAIMKEKGSHELQKPVHERDMGNCHSQKSNTIMRAAAISHLYQLIQQTKTAADHHYHQNLAKDHGRLGDRNPNYLLKTFHLSGAMVENLKKKVLGEGRNSSVSCSSFEVLTAHLWKARTKALGVTKERMVCLQFAVDTRNKMMPSLPKGFSGNAYVLASVLTRAGELEEGSHEAIIEKIKQAKNSVNSDYVNAYMEALDGPQANLPPLDELTLVSDWTRMPFHKVDFLQGDAAYASPLVAPIPQAAYFMQNPMDFGGIDVRISLTPQALDSFSHYFLMNLL
ncbi:hypothetical protein GH714_039483 [Hevea brasiliensis]|uniref:Uncharacterized protein n=1 Tax=Hevea brasiliensis TaxID=3981 RepID=A0A6A6KG39_HEVBR|nr:hypothetical protein GH714_039483 [Hevea brasiliensis]